MDTPYRINKMYNVTSLIVLSAAVFLCTTDLQTGYPNPNATGYLFPATAGHCISISVRQGRDGMFDNKVCEAAAQMKMQDDRYNTIILTAITCGDKG